MRRALDNLYQLSGGLAAAFIVAIVALVFMQVCLNLADKVSAAITGTGLGLTIPSYADFTGFFLAAATFLALAYTLRAGGHIRVTLVLNRLSARAQRGFEIVIVAIAMAMSAFASWYIIMLVYESYEYGDRSSGMVSVPIWLPQLPVAFGLIILTIALLDEFVGLLRGRPASWDGKGENLLSE